MGMFTSVDPSDLTQFLAQYDIENYLSFRAVEHGSVNSNFVVEIGTEKVFLRLYEEQTHAGAKHETDLVVWLAANGVPTPSPRAMRSGARLGELSGKPAALFPFAAGEMSCQRGLTPERMRVLGGVLAHLHALRPPSLWPTRFGVDQLRVRLDRVGADATFGPLASPLRAKLEDAWGKRDQDAPRGMVPGDVFRDNVLWDGAELVALLDFESASEGPLVYDLAVTALAFGFGDRFEATLIRAFFDEYSSKRPLDERERSAIYAEARVACLRFTITRLTDYAMRAGAALAQKDYRRFEARLKALDAMGPAGFRALAGI
ncbi:homoserine kinase [soil metagenome]